MISDSHELKQHARLKASENEKFREVVRRTSASALDALALPLVTSAYSTIDCTQCGQCCKQLRPPVTPEDVQRLIKNTDYSSEAFTIIFLEDVQHPDYRIMACQPCSFLRETTCSVYENRPSSCADYPHLHHTGLKYRIRSVLENYSVCPIVVSVVDQLKEKLVMDTI